MKNSNTSSCLSGSELVDVVVGKAVTASFTFVACLATLILMCLLKVWRKFVYRLTMYLTAVAMLLSLAFVVQVLPVTSRGEEVAARSTEWESVCKAIAFILQYIIWVMLLTICWTIIYVPSVVDPLLSPGQSTEMECRRM